MRPPIYLPSPREICDLYLVNGRLTIINSCENPVKDPVGVALSALAWILSDSARAQRFLDLTGLTPENLRAAIGEPSTHRAVVDFLCAHEPDLIAASESLGLDPAVLASLGEGAAR